MLLGYEEIRHGNSSTRNEAAGLTAGQLLAENFRDVYNLIRAKDPNAPLFTWSDMFDPYHNAKDKFYLWNGDLAGSWEGLPADVTIFNWNSGDPHSLRFFSDRGNEQLIAGYYDQWQDPYGAGFREALRAAGISGVRGMMYTAWWSGFGGLEQYAAGAKAGWVDVPEPSGGSIVGWGSQVVGVDLAGDCVSISAGFDHNLALGPDGSIVAWGSNAVGQCNLSVVEPHRHRTCGRQNWHAKFDADARLHPPEGHP